MKVLRVILSLFVLLSVISCQKTPYLALNTPDHISFSASGGKQDLSFSVNREWTVSSSESWCRVSQSSGKESDEVIHINVICEPNTTYEVRSCTIKIVSGELYEIVSVIQDTNLGLIVSPVEYNLSCISQTLEVEVNSNVKYVIEIDSEDKKWIKHVSTRTLARNILVFQIDANEEYEQRSGQITLRQTDGNLAETVIIHQSQKDGLFIPISEYIVSNESQTIDFEVQSNVEFEVKPDVSWIQHVGTKGLSSSSVTLSIDANDIYDRRTGYVTLIQKNGALSERITINQEEKFGIVVDPELVTLSGEAQAFDVNIDYNVDYEVIIPEDADNWLSLINKRTRGLTEGAVTFSVTDNDRYEKREADVVIKQVNGEVFSKLRIVQDTRDLYTPLTLEAYAKGSVTIDNPLLLTIEYCNSEGSWVEINDKEVNITLDQGEFISFRGDNALYSRKSISPPYQFGEAFTNIRVENCYVFGNIMSLIDSKQYASVLRVDDYCFRGLFAHSNIEKHPKRRLVLPATDVGAYSYSYLFFRNTFTNSPVEELPATTLNPWCYCGMYYRCEYLSDCPKLLARKLTDGCYSSMFMGCANLTCAPELPSTSLAYRCYSAMFAECSNLVEVPDLPAEILSKECYSGMFCDCTSLNNPPKISAIMLAEGSCESMFYGCSNLTRAPELPSRSLARRCYVSMFELCTNLVEAPNLPATTLAIECYMCMFRSCLSLKKAPSLPATELVAACYFDMFRSCLELNYVSAAFIDIQDGNCTKGWLQGVSPQGTFVKNKNATWNLTGESGVPEGWTVLYSDEW